MDDNFQKQLEKLSGFLGYVQGDLMSKKEFTKFIKALGSIWQSLKRSVVEEMNTLRQEVSGQLSELRSEMDSRLQSVESRSSQDSQSKVAALKAAMDDEINMLYAQLNVIQEAIPESTDLSPVYAQYEELRERMPEPYELPSELLDRIEELEKLLKEIQKRPATVSATNHSIVGRDIITDIDISGDLDGATSTFNIQAIYNIISVDLSSYPYGSLRKNIDYTFTPTSITFTSEIDAETQLASGQKCIITAVLA